MRRRPKRNRIKGEPLKLKKYVPVLKFFLVLFLLICPFIVIPRIIKINQVKCESQFGPCSSAILGDLEKAQGSNYLESKKQIGSIFSNDILVSEFSLRFIFPSTFVVNVVEKKPIVALVGQSDQQKFYYIDKDGVVLSEQKSTVLPRIVINGDLAVKVGDRVDSKVSFASEILQGSFILFGSKLAFLNSDSVDVDLPNTIKVVFPISGEVDTLLGSLNLILSQLNSKLVDSTIVGQGLPKVVDLRYKNPVLRYD